MKIGFAFFRQFHDLRHILYHPDVCIVDLHKRKTIQIGWYRLFTTSIIINDIYFEGYFFWIRHKWFLVYFKNLWSFQMKFLSNVKIFLSLFKPLVYWFIFWFQQTWLVSFYINLLLCTELYHWWFCFYCNCSIDVDL